MKRFKNISEFEKVVKDQLENHSSPPPSSIIENFDFSSLKQPSAKTAKIIELIKSNKISFTSAKIILTEILTTETTPSRVAEQKNLFQENDSEKISEMINQIIKENQDIVDRIKSGEDKLVGFLVGQLMKQSNGSVNPGMAKELLLKELEG